MTFLGPPFDNVHTTPATAITARPGPRCPDCGEPMPYYGGLGGYICHDFKVLARDGGWFQESGAHVTDRRLNNTLIRDIRRH